MSDASQHQKGKIGRQSAEHRSGGEPHQAEHEVAALAEPLTARDAETLGLIWKCVSDDTFEDEISNLTARLSKGPTLAYAKIKQAISAADSSDLSEALELECVLQTELGFSSDYKEGVDAFKEKRSPNFKGK
ncbi:MAG: hypothetical protein EBT14_08280 [Betaproteobacteria bacterium]|nr:hypothetical protein [Betaproteobacteria bacterium]